MRHGDGPERSQNATWTAARACPDRLAAGWAALLASVPTAP